MSIQVNGLTKIYKEQTAVNDISFTINKGEIVGFLGPNGAGKSTTMKMLSCFIPPSSGSAIVAGFDILKDPMQVKARVGYLPESNPLYFEMYVREYLDLIAGINKIKNRRQRIEELIEITGLSPECNKQIGQLSKGYKQRVGLAQALLNNPDVLILDEPTSGLDPNQLVDIRKLIKEIGKEKTVMLSTHIMQEVEQMCDRVLIIKSGQIVKDENVNTIGQEQKSSGGICRAIFVAGKRKRIGQCEPEH
jgi:ABC-2 type transport system ATP-binding protein